MTGLVWKCEPCKVEIPMDNNDAIRKHLKTKKHDRLRYACKRCSSTRIVELEGEYWDRDGMRPARKCKRCNTEYKSYAHGWAEKDVSEYTGKWPEHIAKQEAEDFDRRARSRGYVKVDESR